MSGAFSTVHKKFFGAQAVAVKTYSKTQGKEVQRHYQREIWALRTLAFDSEAAAKEQHVSCIKLKKTNSKLKKTPDYLPLYCRF